MCISEQTAQQNFRNICKRYPVQNQRAPDKYMSGPRTFSLPGAPFSWPLTSGVAFFDGRLYLAWNSVDDDPTQLTGVVVKGKLEIPPSRGYK